MRTEKQSSYYLIDCFVNQGFSGGPVVFQKSTHQFDFGIMGVVTGFYFDKIKSDKEKDITQRNSGIGIVTCISHALHLIESNF